MIGVRFLIIMILNCRHLQATNITASEKILTSIPKRVKISIFVNNFSCITSDTLCHQLWLGEKEHFA